MTKNTKHWASIIAGILSLAGYASAANLGSEKYTYDASGNIIEKSIDGQVTQMTYDTSNRITVRQAIGKSKESLSYDAAGRPVTEQKANGQQIRGLTYGYGDKVLKTWKQGTTAGFYYNAEGQLVGKNADGKVSTYTWDGNVLAADGTDPSTNVDHVSGGVPILSAQQDIVVSDYLGNTLASGGEHFPCTAYGEGLESGRFTGKPFIKELGTYIFHHRLYSTATSRWNTRDPLGFPDGLNNYAYVGGDPLCRVDALGTYHQLAYVKIDSSQSNNPNDPLTPAITPGVEISCNILFGHTTSQADEPTYDPDTAEKVSAIGSGNTTAWTLPSASVEAKGAIQDVAESNGTQEYWNNVKIKGFATYTTGTTTRYSDIADWKTDPWEK